MKKVYFTRLDGEFARRLADIFTANGYTAVTEPEEGTEYFIDTTDEYIPGDDTGILDRLDQQAALMAYRKNVSEPLQKLDAVFPMLCGKKRICFLSSAASSINYSEATTGYGHNMAKAALHQIITVTKNRLVPEGYSFRLFDPMAGRMPAEKAAASAYVYFTRDRFNDGPDNPSREDERNVLLRDALGREIPW